MWRAASRPGTLVIVVEAWVARALDELCRQPEVKSAGLVGSRARGDATPLSDYDFRVDLVGGTDAPSGPTATALFGEPALAELWDPLSRRSVRMFVLRGPIKVDLLFSVPNTQLPPWERSPALLPALDAHFWDWIFWLGSKVLHGSEDTVNSELERMQWFLLGPLGSAATPPSIDDAVSTYLRLRAEAEAEFSIEVSKELGAEVLRGLQRHGVLPT